MGIVLLSLKEAMKLIVITGVSYGNLGSDTNAGGADLFLMRFGTDGTRRAAHVYGTPDEDVGWAVILDGDRPVMVGHTAGEMFEGQARGGTDLFLLRPRQY